MQSRLGRSSFVSFRIRIQMLAYFAPHSPEISYIPSTLNSKLKASMSLQKASLISSAVTFFGSICLSSEFERLSSLVWVLSKIFYNHLTIWQKAPPPLEPSRLLKSKIALSLCQVCLGLVDRGQYCAGGRSLVRDRRTVHVHENLRGTNDDLFVERNWCVEMQSI